MFSLHQEPLSRGDGSMVEHGTIDMPIQKSAGCCVGSDNE